MRLPAGGTVSYQGRYLSHVLIEKNNIPIPPCSVPDLQQIHSGAEAVPSFPSSKTAPPITQPGVQGAQVQEESHYVQGDVLPCSL